MFQVATIYDWWDETRAPEYQFLRTPNRFRSALKGIGNAFAVSYFNKQHPSKLLEFGHGVYSCLFDLFSEKCEMWGLDDVNKQMTYEMFDKFRKKYEDKAGSKFLTGFLGDENKLLPDNYFDMICSVSVVEHIPQGHLEKALKQAFEILKPGGLFINSYDIHLTTTKYRKKFVPNNQKAVLNMFHLHNKVGFQWVDAEATPNLSLDKKKQVICFEDTRHILTDFMGSISDEKRLTSWYGQAVSILMAAFKPG